MSDFVPDGGDTFEVVHAFVLASRSGALGEAQIAEFEQLLTDQPEAVDLYLRYLEHTMALPSVLAAVDSSTQPREAAPPLPSSSWIDGALQRSMPFSLTVATLVIGLLISAMAFMAPPFYRNIAKQDSPGERGTDARPFVALLSNFENPIWSEGQSKAFRGAQLLDGQRLALLSGKAEVTYRDGVRVILEGPTAFSVLSAGAGELESGKITVTVPPEGVGYTVGTEAVDVRDLGTQFGVIYSEEFGLEVHVLEGRVALVPGKQLTQGRVIPANEAWALPKRASVLTSVAFDASQFSVEVDAPDEYAHSYEMWREFSEVIRLDPDLIAYYAFEQDESDPAKLRNHAANPVVEDGEITAPHWTNGRWGEKGALQFGTKEQGVRIEIPGEHTQLTLAAWVRLQSAHGTECLFMSDGNIIPSHVHWVIESAHHAPQLRVSAFSVGVLKNDIQGWRPRGWNFVAVTLDLDGGQFKQYANGREIGNRTVEKDSMLLKPETGRIGSWEETRDSIKGKIDEFFVFNRALTSDEVRGIYELNVNKFGGLSSAEKDVSVEK